MSADDGQAPFCGKPVESGLHALLDVVIAGPEHLWVACIETAELLVEVDRFTDLDGHLGRQGEMEEEMVVAMAITVIINN